MAGSTSAVWKLDDGGAYAVNCFPARGIARSTHEGAGSWIVAYAQEQHKKFKSIFKPPDEETFQSTLKVEKTTETTQKGFNNILTEDFLVGHHQVDSPIDLCSVNVTDCELEFGDSADFSKFKNVAYINAAENLLAVRPFTSFPNLRELELPVNGVGNICVQPGDFPTLQVLDLSYNNLSPTDVLSLGYLPKLKVLTLTGNGLSQIHPDLCQPFNIKDSDEAYTRFQSLEVLMLDDNRLRDMATFAALAALPALKELNLDKNDISLVPYLKVMGEKVLSETHSVSHSRTASARHSDGSRSSSRKQKRGSKDGSRSNTPKPTVKINQDKQSATGDDKDTAENTDISFDASSSTLPFQQLRILSLANNKIAEEEHLLAVAAWPALQALILHGNPLVTNSKGEPPLLSHYLTKRLGISVVRFKPKAPVVKPNLRVPAHEARRISTRVPKIPKQPVDIMIEALRKPALGPVPHPPDAPKSTDLSSKEHRILDRESDQDNVFLTQVQDEVIDHPTQQNDKMEEAKQEEGGCTPPVEDIIDILKDAKPDPDIHENLSIQGNVKMLRQILQHPLAVTTVDPAPERRARKFKYRDQSLVTIQKLDVRSRPRPDAKLMRHKRVEDTLNLMNDKPAAAVELPLIEALHQSDDKELQSEADALLSEIESKYRVVREESLKASRQAQRALKDTKQELANLQINIKN